MQQKSTLVVLYSERIETKGGINENISTRDD